MAVGPARTLLAAHAQATWNRSRRELGSRGRVVYLLILTLAGLLAILPVLGLSLAGGFVLGRGLPDPGSARILGGVLGAMTLLGGLAGGVAGGSRVLAWEATRVYPVRLPSLFLAELVAGVADLLPMVIALASGCLLLGAGAGNARLLPLLPLPWAGTVAGMLCLQHLVGSLAAQAVKRLRAGLALLALCAWMGLSLLPSLEARHGGPGSQLLQALLGHASPFLAALGRAALATPPLQCAEGLRQASLGHWGSALAHQAYPAAALALLLLATAFNLAREADPQHLRVVSKAGPEPLWTFTTPLGGVARLHWHTVITSHLGKAGFLLPLMVIVVLKGPAAASGSASAWAVPAGFAYLALSGVQLQLNQFGLDGPGVKALLLLPLEARELLAGKALGLAAYMGAQTLVLMSIMILSGSLAPAQMLPALCLSACLFLVQISLGHWTSAWLPRPMPRDSLRNSNMAGAVIWLGMAASIAGALFFGGLWLLLAWLAPLLLAPAMVLLAAALFLLYRRAVLPAAAAYLDRRREAVVQALG